MGVVPPRDQLPVARIKALSRAARAATLSTKEFSEAMKNVAGIASNITKPEYSDLWDGLVGVWRPHRTENNQLPPTTPLIPKPRSSRAYDLEDI